MKNKESEEYVWIKIPIKLFGITVFYKWKKIYTSNTLMKRIIKNGNI